MENTITIIDIVVALLLLIFFYIFATGIKSSHIEKEPYYKYFIPGLFLKIFGGIAVCLVYIYYYGGGDTIAYHHDNVCLSKLFLKSPLSAIKYSFVNMDDEFWSVFDQDTDWPWFAWDEHSVYVNKVTWPLSLVTFNSFIGQTMLLAYISFFAMWRLYKMFITEFPILERGMAFAILFIPSVFFWGSGLLKDTITMSGIALFTSSFYKIIKQREGYLVNSFLILFGSWLLIKIKPYIFFALLPGSLIWFTGYQMEKLRNNVVRSAITPILLVITVFVAFLFLKNMGDSLGEYAVDNVLTRAVDSQHDLKQDYYKGSSFDIGEIDPSIRGVLSKAPIAIVSALFRPFLWESYNPAMIVSGLENLVILIFTLYLLFQLRVYNFFKLLFKNHLLVFSVSFSLFFSFAVGLTTSNFGSLVRYKIPAIPFFVASLLITNYYYKLKKQSDEEAEESENREITIRNDLVDSPGLTG